MALRPSWRRSEALERLDLGPDDEAETVRRLFDDRPDDELVDWETDWHPTGGPMQALDACDTLDIAYSRSRAAWSISGRR